ncbi:N-acetyltransferase [Methanoregula sp.]|jgi:acetyltransferase-like isoleucine patch superfamily enzyme|uniref:acyltransferase n=1 Tax=Methanoregula sp. TaxID=2052170 RepID=UPI0026347AB2|nr:N-acetyltransferase [Methanoregula sp.]MDD5142275.1 DapH/DapD/GlmU-related protein [Methanoregula sp.]
MIEYGKNVAGENARIFDPVTLGFPSRENLKKTDFTGTTIGKNAVIRSGTILYCDVAIGDDFQTGHNVMIREKTTIGNRVSVGTGTVIEGHTVIGSDVSIQSMVFIPTDTQIGDHVFIGPNAVLTNDRYPPTRIGGLRGPVIKKGAAIGANTTILPGVCIGEGALVAAGSVVTRDVPDHMLAIGSPARLRQLPSVMKDDA